MPGSVLIVPSLLSADFSQLATELRRVERAGCTWIHLDIMDNHFVPNLTFGPPVVATLRKVTSKLFFDTHLMVTDPGSLIEPFAQAGAQLLTVHAEAARRQLPDLLKSIRAHGMKAGVSIKPATPVSAIEEILPQTDLVLVMTVEPGFGGQTLMPACLNKIRTLKKLRSAKRGRFLIEVDGGINLSTIELAVAAGAELLVAGSAIFSGGSVRRNVAALRQAAGV